MTIRVSKSQFKAKALEYFRQVQSTGKPIVITDHGKPALELRPIDRPAEDVFERLKGSVLFYDGPFDPIDEDEWEALK